MNNHLDRVPLNEVISLRLLGMETPGLFVSFSGAFRWLRERHGLKFSIKDSEIVDGMFEYDIRGHSGTAGYRSYEEAELACLRELIKIVSNEKKYRPRLEM